MPADWTGEAARRMHLSRITKVELAARLHYTPEYVSMVLNGKKEPRGAETKFMDAIREIEESRKN